MEYLAFKKIVRQPIYTQDEVEMVLFGTLEDDRKLLLFSAMDTNFICH